MTKPDLKIIQDNTDLDLTTNHLDRSARLIAWDIGRWSGRAADLQASAELTDDKDADAGVARVYKDLVSADALTSINKIYRKATARIAARTVPWEARGRNLCPIDMIIPLHKDLEAIRDEFFEAVDDLCANYQTLVAEQSASLGALFNANDYPTVASVRAKFRFNWDFVDVPSTDTRVTLPDSFKREMQTMAIRTMNARLKEAETAVFDRVYKMVVRLDKIMTSDKPKVFEALIDDLRLLLDTLSSLNVTDNPKMEAMHKHMEQLFADVGRDDLKDETTRAKLAAPTDKLKSQLEHMLGM